jgi:hypothetical protein
VSEPQEPPVLEALTALEQRVIDAARRGEPVKLETEIALDEISITEDLDLRVRAELVRELLMGRRGVVDPRGIEIRRVRLVGPLDLDYVVTSTRLVIAECALPDGVHCYRARLLELNLSGSRVSCLAADGLRTDGNVILENASITGTDKEGAVRLLGAQIGGQLDLRHSKISTNIGHAVIADGLRIGGDFALVNASITATDEEGAVRLPGVQVGGQLQFSQAIITNFSGPALVADNIHIEDNLFLDDVTISGAGKTGALRLPGARVGGQVILDRAVVTNVTGSAIYADTLHTDGHIYLRNAAITGTDEGAVRLLSAQIGGQLHLSQTTITNVDGPAIYADNLHTENNIYLDKSTISGKGKLGAVALSGARIGAYFSLRELQVDNASGPLLDLDSALVIGPMTMPASVVCPGPHSTAGRSTCPHGERQIAMNGFRYPTLQGVSWRQWLHLVTYHTGSYRPQPYQQLASVERVAGHDNNARHVLIEQQEDLRRRAPEALGGRIARSRHWLWGWLGRYGYRAHRLVTTLAVALALAGGLGYIAGQVSTRPGHHAAERVLPPTTPVVTPGIPCSTAELIGVGIDRGLPLGTTGLRARCDLDTGTRRGQAFTFAIWVLQALMWALATLAIAAYTGMVRKPT